MCIRDRIWISSQVSLVTNMPCLGMCWSTLCQGIVENEQTYTIINVYWSKPKTWYFKSNLRSKNRIPGPDCKSSPKSSIFKSYPQNLQKPDPNPQWIDVLYQENIQYKMLIRMKVPWFQVNILRAEPRCYYSWSIGCMSTSFRFIYSPRKIPGKRPTNPFVYHIPQTLRVICAIYSEYSSPKRWLAHIWKPPTNDWRLA